MERITYKYIKGFGFLLLFWLLIFTACNEEKESSSGEGYIILGVGKNETLYTKAGEPVEDEILGVYFIAISGDTIKQFENYKEEVEGQRILLPAGSYQIAVSSAPLDEPQWDSPAYYGDTVLFITEGEVVSASIECKITNTKVSVEFTEYVDYYFSDYEAVVKGNSGALTFVKGETRSGFYATDELVVTLNW
ncbi:MAG: DUF4493 domain-containing protein [Tannerellaceae bacterium]|nr:DUF4493 domain-containing protein [Tannerellaceae bacterium]